MEIKQQNLGWRRLGLQSSVFSLRSPRGFTLIELLVAMGILMIIVMLMANLFKQSSLAWETGIRQAKTGLEARALMGMIQQELSQAVPGRGRSPFVASGGTLDFWTLGQPTGGEREATRSTYTFNSYGNVLKNLQPVLENVVRFDVISSSTNDPPEWVDIYLEISAERKRSEVRVYAVGYEGVADTRR